MKSVREAEELVIIEIVSGDEFTPNRKFTGTLRDAQPNRLILVAGERIAEAASLRVQSKALLWLGEVLSCAPEPEVTWTVHMRVKRTILIL